MKTVSIVICTYNGEKFIQIQLESILKQSYPIFEILIQDDCSTDKTWEIIEGYSKKYKHIKSFRNHKRLGPHRNFTTAILKCKGEYISPCDQDDIWLKDKIMILINFIGNNLLAYSQSLVNFQNGNSVGLFHIRNPYISINDLIWDNRFLGHAFIFHKSLLPFYKKSLEIDNQNPKFTQLNAYDHVAPLAALAFNSLVITSEILQIWNRHNSVCNQQFVYSGDFSTHSKTINNYKKFVLTSLRLIKRKKSNAILETFYSRYELLSFIYQNKQVNVSKDIKYLSLICLYVAKQTFVSYCKAGILNCRIYYKSIKGIKLRKKIGVVSYRFRFPFIFWYDMNKVKCL